MKNEQKIVYYSDEVHEDFANNGINTKKVDENYKYITKNPFSRFFGKLMWIVFLPVAWLVGFILYHPKFVGKKNVLRKVKKKGYFIYCNHVLPVDPLVPPTMLNPTKYCVIAASADTFSINKALSWIIKSFGGFPVPNSPKMYYNYVDFIKYQIGKKHRVLMYPEAHIWPYCNWIRRYTSTSFKYPVMLNAPIITMTTCFVCKKPGKKPKQVIYVDGPFYPNMDLKFEDAVEDLRNQAFEQMNARAKKYSTYEYVKYVKKTSE